MFRTFKDHCAIYDFSYLSCVQISMKTDVALNTDSAAVIVEFLKPFIDVNNGHNGNLMGAGIFKSNGRIVCPAEFQWSNTESVSVKKLWLWVHPCSLKEISDILQSNIKDTIQIEDLSYEFNRFSLFGQNNLLHLKNILVTDKNNDDKIKFMYSEKSSNHIIGLHVEDPRYK